jgi:hypothetical protein
MFSPMLVRRNRGCLQSFMLPSFVASAPAIRDLCVAYDWQPLCEVRDVACRVISSFAFFPLARIVRLRRQDRRDY